MNRENFRFRTFHSGKAKKNITRFRNVFTRKKRSFGGDMNATNHRGKVLMIFYEFLSCSYTNQVVR